MRLLSRVGVVLLIAVIVSVGPLSAFSPARAQAGGALLGAAVAGNPYFLGLLALLVAGGYAIANWDQLTSPGGVAEWFVTSEFWTPQERLFMLGVFAAWVESGLWLELDRPDLTPVSLLAATVPQWQWGVQAGVTAHWIENPAPGTRIMMHAPGVFGERFLASVSIRRVFDDMDWTPGYTIPYAWYLNGVYQGTSNFLHMGGTGGTNVTSALCGSEEFEGYGQSAHVMIELLSYAADPAGPMVLAFRDYGNASYAPTSEESCSYGGAVASNPTLTFLAGVAFPPGHQLEDYSIAVPTNFSQVVDVDREDAVAGSVPWISESEDVLDDTLPYPLGGSEWDPIDTGLDTVGIIAALNQLGQNLLTGNGILSGVRAAVIAVEGAVTSVKEQVIEVVGAVEGVVTAVLALPATLVSAIEAQLVTWFVPTYTLSTEIAALEADMQGRFPLAVVPIMGCASGIFSGGASPLVVTLPSPLSPGGSYELVIEAPAGFQTTCRTVTGFCLVLLLIAYYVRLARRFLFAGG